VNSGNFYLCGNPSLQMKHDTKFRCYYFY